MLSEYGQKLDERAKLFLHRLRAAGERMNAQIEQMLSLHKLSQTELQLQTVNLSNIAQEILINLKANEPHRQVETTIQEGLKVCGDPILLRVMLENLLSNAWKYTSKREVAKIEFGAILESGGSPKFYVRDNGAGFNIIYAKKLFRPFQRMHSQAEFPGTGVGLASVQRIVQKHGGQIWAEAAVDRGATFYFTLPVERENKNKAIS